MSDSLKRSLDDAGLSPFSAPALLLAEIARLQGELAAAESTIAALEARADVDPLVGLLNRRGFERELKRALAYVRRYRTQAALVYIDLDGFKPVNDRHGHAAGDDLLKAVAAALASHVRASDTVARLGGDEFVALLWNLEAAQAAAKAIELECVIEAATVTIGDVHLSVGASAGAVTLEPDALPAAVLAAADRAMYARKGARRS